MNDLKKQIEIQDFEEVIRKLKQENKTLRIRAKNADHANRTKSDFLAMISHEIRTPMNGVIGLTELLLSAELEEKQKRFAELILTSGRNLLTLINSLLDFSKIEANRMVIERGVFDLPVMLRELVELYALTGQQQQKNIQVVSDIDENIHKLYIGDSYRIRQILVNLLGNAVKFTERGTVCLQVKCVGRGVGSDLLRFSVSDTGPGIVRDKQGQVFLPFTQFGDPSKKNNVGTGLGLAICAKLVDMMNGSIGLDSTVGKGSSFWFKLDLPIGKEKKEVVPEDKRRDNFVSMVTERAEDLSSSLTILIVDDEPVNRLVLCEFLQQAGFAVVEASDGREAVEWCKKRKFDLVFMDCLMPVMDGFAAATAILGIDDTLPVIALTADATLETRERCRKSGMAWQLLKPLDFDELGRLLSSFLPDSGKKVRGGYAFDQKISAENDDGEKVIDFQMLDNLRLNIGDIAPAVKVFIRNMDGHLRQISAALQEGDRERAARSVHTLKGSASQFGAVELSELCQQMEIMAGAGNLVRMGSLLFEIQHAAEIFGDILSKELD